MNPDWRSRYEVAVEAAQEAGQVALKYFTGEVKVEWKADQSPVTVADREAESLLWKKFLTRFPKDGFLGEESGITQGSSGYRWIVDPIDGTKNFIRGVPIWGTLIGLEYREELIAGVINIPTLNQTWRALKGDGAFRDNTRVHVSKRSRLEESMMFYSSMSWFMKAGNEQNFIQLVRSTWQQRGYGDFYGHLLVVQGSGEMMVEYGVHSWDVAAIKPIIEEAGGRFSNWSGEPTIHTPDVLISNGLVHDEVLALLRPFGKS